MTTEDTSKQRVEHIEGGMAAGASLISEAAERQIQFEKQLGFMKTLKVFWRSTLWVLYGQLVVFGYGIDGNIAGNLLAIPKFR